jgi:hypothetical protein
VAIRNVATEVLTHGRKFYAARSDRRSRRTLYAAIARNLAADPGVRPEDVLVNLVEVVKENWSFGNGLASYAT